VQLIIPFQSKNTLSNYPQIFLNKRLYRQPSATQFPAALGVKFTCWKTTLERLFTSLIEHMCKRLLQMSTGKSQSGKNTLGHADAPADSNQNKTLLVW
jgi:hypothetical protein